MRIAWVMVVLAGCGRGNFEIDADVDGARVVDAGNRPNIAFVTSSTTVVAMLASPVIASADAVCAGAAQGAGLTGTFIAWIATSASNPIDRLAGSRGWVRVDGAPIADTVNGLVGGVMFNPIDVDEHGIVVDPQTSVWTGTDANGRLTENCNDWVLLAIAGTMGFAGGGWPVFTNVGVLDCVQPASLYCFEVGHSAAVAPQPNTGGRLAFLSHPRSTTDTSIGLVDQICADDASANGIAGSFAAAIATDGNSLASRFSVDARPWQRVDGTRITTTGAQLFDETNRLSIINQTADGSYTASDLFTGAANPSTSGTSSDCANWSDTMNNANATAGQSARIDGGLWVSETDGCDSADRFLCLEE